MKRLLFFLSLLSSLPGSAQFTDRYWAFGDSAGIDFRIPTSPVAAESILRSRGTCASICDSIGNLLFYTGTPNSHLWPQTTLITLVYVPNEIHQSMDKSELLRENLV